MNRNKYSHSLESDIRREEDRRYTRVMPATEIDGSDVPREAPSARRHLGYQQRRSLETFEVLLGAAEELIATKPFDDISVAEICERAGVSVGAFYRRFESKDGLLLVILDRYLETVLRLQATELDPSRWADVPLAELIERLVGESMDMVRANVAPRLARTIRTHSSVEFARADKRIEEEFFASATRLLLRRVDEIDHPRPRLAAEYCVYQLVAVMRHHLWAPAGGAVTHFTDEQVRQELAASLLAYLCPSR
ncbi:TetR family transcriptional regulator [Mycobacteroides abscessus subsp. abscessus]|nr:TetR family transcriptional regulator [Mycobacteroides abscessus subsp. abscessus]